MLKSLIQTALGRFGYQITKKQPAASSARAGIAGYPDLESGFLEHIYPCCADFTMTSVARTYSLHKAVRYVVDSGLEGDIVECGVWRGGSSMVAALSLLELEDTSRTLYLYDTFSGMSEPTEKDVDFDGRTARAEWESSQQDDHNEWCYASLGEVRTNIRTTGYPEARIRLVQGRVEDTIPETVPDKIAILRLDTDWYESTYHELTHLFPRLAKNGVLIIDDYGYWKGAREATDQYIQENGIRILLNRIDNTGRIGIKTE